ncbi:hypothetical protein HN935_00750 [archaeon]|jgi:hypothetical protein|nr:hypothetical protein [archaeon]
MVVGEVAMNTSGLVDQVIPVLMDKLGPFITIFKAVGIVLLVYIIYLLYRGVTRIQDRRRLKRIEKKVLDIDRKLNKLLKKKNK